jgi:hypothetical protein
MHGLTVGKKQPPAYQIWSQIKQRVLNPKCKKYPRYGGRGIDMDPRWITSSTAFIDDMGPRPSSKHTIDRTDNDKGYWPWNCRWATRSEQNRNTMRNQRFLYKGRMMTIADIVDETGIDKRRLQDRLASGLDVQTAVERPVERGFLYFTYKGEEHSLAVWAEKLKLSYEDLYREVVRKGVDFQTAVAVLLGG